MTKTYLLETVYRDYHSFEERDIRGVTNDNILFCGKTFRAVFPLTVQSERIKLTVSTKRQYKKGERKIVLLPCVLRYEITYIMVGTLKIQIVDIVDRAIRLDFNLSYRPDSNSHTFFVTATPA